MLATLVVHTYFCWQPQDLSNIAGREKILKEGKSVQSVNLLSKVQNATKDQRVVKITEEDLNRYIAANLKLEQTGVLKKYSEVKGVYVDLTPDNIEVIIERHLAQYDDDGNPKDGTMEPRIHTVAMKFNIYTTKEGTTTKIITKFPGGTFGKAPAPGLYVKLVKGSFDNLKKHFADELKVGYKEMVAIKIGDGYIELDPRKPISTASR
eukprot:Seg19309.1 transcript_id=Seg19309.1/GoldUCD/mRNA.D3Y31 product="hypothetical protein" protein_id=Seg19309.1/GoldUCD/D3Y31